MKKIIFLISLIIVLATSFYFYHKSTSEKYVADTSNSQPVETTILLYPESGEVSWKVKSDDVFQVATASPTVIPNNAIVHTGIGKASILLPDNSSVSLDQNTEITVNYSPNKTSMYQNFGTTYHRVQKLITGASYQVQTAGTLAAVRGTKFAVSYDIKKKKTKIAVTESKVEVSTITKATTTGSTPQEESMMLEVGKTVTVDVETPKKEVNGKKSAMLMVDTKADVEMNAFVEEKKKGDADMEMIKKEEKEKNMDKQEVRKEIKRILFKDEKGDTEKKEETKREDSKPVVEEKKVEVKETTKVEATASKTTTTVKTDTTVTSPVVKEVVPVVTKMEEEKFFTLFEPLFIKYFYIDETDSVCSITISPEDRTAAVYTFAANRGYAFTKVTLPSFARAIDEYCANKDKAVKARLQARFDDEYPF